MCNHEYEVVSIYGSQVYASPSTNLLPGAVQVLHAQAHDLALNTAEGFDLCERSVHILLQHPMGKHY